MNNRFEVALIILYDSKKRFLLQHRTLDAHLLPDHWAFFGGRMEKGENPEEAVLREAFEELNYRLTKPELVLEEDFMEGRAHGRIYVFIENFDAPKSILSLQEGQGLGWYREKETEKLKMVQRDRKILEFIDNYLSNSFTEARV